jgi:D-alanine-D-alanine ligase
MDSDRFEVTSAEITEDGQWVLGVGGKERLSEGDAIKALKAMETDCVFIALHGPHGEDGRIQGVLDDASIRYTGSGSAASAVAMDKVLSKEVVSRGGIRVGNQVVFQSDAWPAEREALTRRVETELGFPCVVKSPQQGSSLGMAMPQEVTDFAGAVDEVLPFGLEVMVEEFLSGVELTCGVLDAKKDSAPIPMPVTEIRPRDAHFFDYHAKYTPGATDEITPAKIDEDVRERVQQMAVQAHGLIGCSGFSRSDMILTGDEVVWLEINTIPGLTDTSLFPQAAVAAGMTLPELYGMLVEAALA